MATFDGDRLIHRRKRLGSSEAVPTAITSDVGESRSPALPIDILAPTYHNERPGRLTALLLSALSLALVALGQYVLSSSPDWHWLPLSLEAGLQPIWPNPDAAVMAIGLFVAAMIVFGSVALASPSDAPPTPETIPRLHRPAPHHDFPRYFLGAAGLALIGWILERLATSDYQPEYPRWFGLGVVLLLAALAYREWPLWNSIARKLSIRLLAIESLGVAAMLAVFVAINRVDLGSWYYFSIGDEFAFFLASRQAANGDPRLNLFSQKGPYEIIPWLSSYSEGLLMRLLGTDLVGWKLSVVVIGALGLLGTYVLARILFNQRVAFITLGMLVTAHYLLAYGHTGYPNLEIFLPTAGAVALFVIGVRHRSSLALFGAGLFAALGWYTYYPSRAAIVIVGIAIVLTVAPRNWIRNGLPILGGFLVLLLPLMLVSKTEVITRMFEQTGGGSTTQIVANPALLPWWNVGRSLLAFNYNTYPGPYVYGSLAEPVTAGLFMLGLGYAIAEWRRPANRLLLIWFAVGIIVDGVLSKYDHVSVSRLIFLMPVVALVAACAFDRIVSLLGDAVRHSRWKWDNNRITASAVLVLALLTVVTWSNLYRWFVLAPHELPSTAESLTMRIVELPRCQDAPLAPLIVADGIGGAMGPALTGVSGIVQPRWGLYAEPPTWIATAPTRCIIFRTPGDATAIPLERAIAARWPDLQPVAEPDLAGLTKVLVYFPKG